ncbi:energy-coupling factor ABC transporter ATP-binding protein [Parenemella sanctibonifatiensis]|uniref:Cobalt ABC transporter ATP-binding protein n=1 Tax=Parenemella sanctibonifatiensis TaxID=2016505 RepID=A0A255EJ97_9ACTN|nr:ABC transporter ATP-binding protein [Parenemella sanctibonifatiensis]OYN91310.1 cobalt ABC transporter ATP-binding protein [Parenemella sanctibonifatiensis]
MPPAALPLVPEHGLEFADVQVFAQVGEARRTILGPLSLQLTEHRICLVGANGSGKSTLLRLGNGLVRPDTGTVTVAGRPAYRQRDRVGFLFADPLAQLIMPTARQDIELSLRRRIRSAEQRRAAAEDWLDRLGLLRLADQSVHDLSGGERQLVALTAVLASEPEILLCDEPTTLLDLRNRTALLQRLADLPQQLIIATHDLDLAAQSDRVIVLDQGTVIVDGPPEPAIATYRDYSAGQP